MQQVPVTGAVIVTTPQDVALLDVGRTMAMFAQVSTPVLGVVENMSGYVCPQCGTEDPLFGRGGAAGLAERFRVPLLARIPLVPAVREGGDRGQPIVVAAPPTRSASCSGAWPSAWPPKPGVSPRRFPARGPDRPLWLSYAAARQYSSGLNEGADPCRR